MPDLPMAYVGVGGALLLLGLFLLYRHVFLWRRYDSLRSSAARHHNWPEVIMLGSKQESIRAGGPDFLHEMAVALRHVGRAEEAFGYARRLQLCLYQDQTGIGPQHAEDYGEVSAFHHASSHYLRSMQIIGEAWLRRGQPQIAREILEYLAGHGGKFIDSNVPLAMAYLRLGEDDRATAALRSYLAVAPGKAVSTIRAGFEDMLDTSPESRELRAFQAEFLQLEGRVRDELDRLLPLASRGGISGGEILLMVELARLADATDEVRRALDEGAEALAARPGLQALLAQVSGELGASGMRIGVIAQTVATLMAGEPTGEELAAVANELSATASEPGVAPDVSFRAAELLLQLGDLAGAHNIAASLAEEEFPDNAVAALRSNLQALKHEQSLYEAPHLLAGSPGDDQGGWCNVTVDGVAHRLQPSLGYRRLLSGQALSEEDRHAAVYELTAACLAAGPLKKEMLPLLQEVATGETLYRDAAALRLARVLAADGDHHSSREYFQRLKSLDGAIRADRDGALTDAFELAVINENSAPDFAVRIFRDISLIDLSFRDVRRRRDALINAGYLPESDTSPAGPVASVTLEPSRPLGRADTVAGGMTGLLAGFGGANPSGMAAGKPSSGELIDGRYRVEGILGEGGMGTVYRCLDTRLDRDVAVKLVHPTLGGGFLKANERFRQEAQLAGKLFQNKGVITVLDLGEGPPPYIVMEYVTGDSLAVCIAEVSLTQPEKLSVLRDVADTLGFAHSEGIIHRDIKPANIIIEREPLAARVADFGLARLADEANRLTVSGAIIGTKMYMAPEQIRGEDVDGRVDMYAWGVMAYELITGLPPFTTGEITYQHCYVVPKVLSEVPEASGWPEPFLDLIMACLFKDRDDRPATFAEVLSTIDDVAGR